MDKTIGQGGANLSMALSKVNEETADSGRGQGGWDLAPVRAQRLQQGSQLGAGVGDLAQAYRRHHHQQGHAKRRSATDQGARRGQNRDVTANQNADHGGDHASESKGAENHRRSLEHSREAIENVQPASLFGDLHGEMIGVERKG